MKTLILFFLLFTSASFAQTQIFPDAVGYETIQGPYRKEIHVVQGYEPFESVWIVLEQITFGWTNRRYRYYPKLANGAVILKDCEKDGGIKEQIQVKAGVFESCKYMEPNRTVWYGDVPIFALLKIQPHDNSMVFELVCFITSNASAFKEKCYL